jgi:hypothetical protein
VQKERLASVSTRAQREADLADSHARLKVVTARAHAALDDVHENPAPVGAETFLKPSPESQDQDVVS